MAVETNVIILPFGAVFTYAIVPNSPAKIRWYNDNQCL